MKQYETVIGLEVHVELATKTKIFCGCKTDFGAAPNTHVCPICTGMPGSLPILNKQVVEFALRAGLALNCQINQFCKFDRKNYFYPDNPQNYQISQLYLPTCHDGYVELETAAGTKRIGIHEIHMEEDAGKLVHDEWTDSSLVDYNRSGVPLIEIVSEPDMRSADEVIQYLEHLQSTMQYLGVSDCRLQEGSMRADVNLSVREVGSPVFGTRTEMKNLNSFKAIAHAIEGERERQIELLEDGRAVVQETRRWDDNKEASHAMRSKEDAKDYRYFPDPDLIAVEISDEWMKQIESEVPELPITRYERYLNEYGMTAMEARLISDSFEKAELLDAAAKQVKPKAAANWILSDISKYLNDKAVSLKDTKMTADKLVALVKLIEAGTISGNAGKKVLPSMFETDETVEAIVERMGLKQVSDEGAILAIVQDVLAKNEKAVADFKAGKNVTGFLVGQCMKASKGQGNPQIINKLIAAELAKL